MEHVSAATTDMNAHTVTVTFDDAKTDLGKIEAALNDAGYMVKGHEKVE